MESRRWARSERYSGWVHYPASMCDKLVRLLLTPTLSKVGETAICQRFFAVTAMECSAIRVNVAIRCPKQNYVVFLNKKLQKIHELSPTTFLLFRMLRSFEHWTRLFIGLATHDNSDNDVIIIPHPRERPHQKDIEKKLHLWVVVIKTKSSSWFPRWINIPSLVDIKDIEGTVWISIALKSEALTDA